jgi:hypothetical protein
MFNIKRDRIYQHSHLDPREAERLRPLMESAFRNELAQYNNRPELKEEKLRFITEQYANRCRVARTQGATPLNEDAAIFGHLSPQISKLFESVSEPGNIINLGNVRNPMNATDVTGGMWNNGYKPGTGDIPSYVFGLQNQLALHCIGFDLIPTIAVDTPKPVIIYVDTVYGNGALDTTGDDLPSYLEFTCPKFTKTWIDSQKLKRGITELIIFSAASTVNSGLEYTGTTAAPIYALKIRFIVSSTIKPAITAEVLASATITSTVTLSNLKPATIDGAITWDNAASVKAVVDAIAAASAGSIVVPNDPGTVGVVADYDTTAFYANYASATRTNITEAATNNNSLKGMSREQHEKGPVNKLNVVAIDKQLEIVGFEIEADTTNIQIKDMAAMGINVISYLYSGVQNQLVQSLDEHILTHLYALGVEHAANVKEAQGIDYNLYLADATQTGLNLATLNLPFSDMNDNDRSASFPSIQNLLLNTAYENQITHNERLYRRILLVSEFLKQQNRIGPADAIVFGGELAAAVKGHSTFTICPTPNTLSETNDSISYYGTIFGSIHVYKNSKIPFTDPRILMIRRGNDTDPGAKLLAYDLASSRQIVAERTMAEKIRVWSRFTIADIGFYPELNYFTFIAINQFAFA